MQVMMPNIFIKNQHKQEIIVVCKFQDAFGSIMFLNQTVKSTSSLTRCNGKYENINIFKTANILYKFKAIVRSTNRGC